MNKERKTYTIEDVRRVAAIVAMKETGSFNVDTIKSIDEEINKLNEETGQ